MKTLFVNLFAGPGCGKSTNAAGVFHQLKKLCINAEYIQEYAKDATWRHDRFTLECQPYVTGKQLFRQYRLNGQVEVAVTDSPVLMGLAYGGFGVTENYKKWLVEAHGMFDTLNILLVRNPEAHPYLQKGRSQTENDAKQIDTKVENLLLENEIFYHTVKVGDDSVESIMELIKHRLNQPQ